MGLLQNSLIIDVLLLLQDLRILLAHLLVTRYLILHMLDDFVGLLDYSLGLPVLILLLSNARELVLQFVNGRNELLLDSFYLGLKFLLNFCEAVLLNAAFLDLRGFSFGRFLIFKEMHGIVF